MIPTYSLTYIVHISIGVLFNLFHEDFSAFRKFKYQRYFLNEMSNRN